MRMKRVVSILAAAVLVFGLTGCNAITIDGETENASGEMSGNGSIGFSVSTLNNPFFVTLSEGAKEKAKTEGEKLIVVDAGDDAAKQTSDDRPEQRRQGDEQVEFLHFHVHPFRLSRSSTWMVFRLRNSATRMARPIADSAAATVSTKKTNTCPARSCR